MATAPVAVAPRRTAPPEIASRNRTSSQCLLAARRALERVLGWRPPRR